MRLAKAVAARTEIRIVQKLSWGILADLAAPGNPVSSRSITMIRYLWHLDPDGWPLERIGPFLCGHLPVFPGSAQELAEPGDGRRPIFCSVPKVSVVADWDWP